MKAQVGMKVRAYEGSCIGIIIQSTEWQGEIIKVNKKSIRVRLTESTSMRGKKITNHRENMRTEVTYRFVKTLSVTGTGAKRTSTAASIFDKL